MMIQLNPMVPVYIPKFKMEGYAFLVTRESQETYTIFTVAVDNGEIWDLTNREVRFCINHTMDRHKINKEPKSQFMDKFNGPDDNGSPTPLQGDCLGSNPTVSTS